MPTRGETPPRQLGRTQRRCIPHGPMLAIPGYRLEKRLHASKKSAVVAATREADGLEVVLKRYASDSAKAEPRARREFELLRAIDGSGAVRALELLETDGTAVLVLERISGLSLYDYVRARTPSPAVFLELAVQLA